MHQPSFVHVKQTPRGSVVVCGDRLVTDEITDEDAIALATRINHAEMDRAARKLLAWT